jgi:hypothetical protein
MGITGKCEIELPAWVAPFLEDWREPLATIGQRMQLAIAISEQNVMQKTGGPFGAIVVSEETGKISLFENGKWDQGVSVAEMSRRLSENAV